MAKWHLDKLVGGTILCATLCGCGPSAPIGNLPRLAACLDEQSDQHSREAIRDDVDIQVGWLPKINCELWHQVGRECPADDGGIDLYFNGVWGHFDEFPLGQDQAAYRLIVRGTLIRVTHRKDRIWVVVKKTRAFIYSRSTVQTVRRCVVPLSLPQWLALEASVQRAGFWSMPAFVPDDVSMVAYDGPAVVLLEGVSPSRHHLIKRSWVANNAATLDQLVDAFVSVAEGCCVEGA